MKKNHSKKEVNKEETQFPRPSVLRKGFHYQLVLKNSKFILYKQRSLENNVTVGYEVHLIKFQKERFFRGIRFEEKIQFPHDEAFGKWAWSYGTLNSAIKNFISLTKTGKTLNDLKYEG